MTEETLSRLMGVAGIRPHQIVAVVVLTVDGAGPLVVRS